MSPPSGEKSSAKKAELFPSTDWIALDGAKLADRTSQDDAAAHFAESYWRPVYCYLRGFGHDRHRAEDLTQEFFARFFDTGALAKADARRGRFRSFLLGSLANYLRNQHRDARAAKRIPPEMVSSIHAVIERDAEELLPRDHVTPEAAFNHAWTVELLRRVLGALESEMRGRQQIAHFDIFRRLLVAPNLEGAVAPDYATLAREHGLSVAQVGFRLTTARRAFRERLEREVRTFARSEAEVQAEIDALFTLLARA